MGQAAGGCHAAQLARLPELASLSAKGAFRKSRAAGRTGKPDGPGFGLGKTAGGCRAIGREMLRGSARLSVEPDGWMGRPAGLVKGLDGSGRLMGQDAGKCQAAEWAGLLKNADLPGGLDCQGMPDSRIGQTSGKCQGAG